MADKISLTAETRATIGNGVKALRRSGKVPAVVYGRGIAPVHVQLDLREVSNALRKAGRNRLITLTVAGVAPSKNVLTREVQRDPIKRTIQHIDFYEVSMTEKIRARVRIVSVGEPEDVKSGVGVLLTEKNAVEIECLPADLFDTIEINVSQMKVDDVVRVKDIIVPAGVKILDDPEDEVVRMTRFVEAKVEEVVPAEPVEVEVIEKGKKEEEVEAEEAEGSAKKK